MKQFASFFTLVAVPVALAQNFMINTPTGVTSCQPTRFVWTGGQQPFFLTLTTGTTAGGAVIKEFDNLTGSAFTWLVDVQGNTQFILNLKDSTGTIAQSAPVDVASGSDTSCINTSVSESVSGQTSGGAAPTTGGSTPPATSAPPATSGGSTPTFGGSTPTSGGSTPSSGSPSGSGSAAPSHSSGAATKLTGGLVMTGLMGLIGAALS